MSLQANKKHASQFKDEIQGLKGKNLSPQYANVAHSFCYTSLHQLFPRSIWLVKSDVKSQSSVLCKEKLAYL